MRVRKIGEWSFSKSSPHGDAGCYIEAVDAADDYRYAAISYSFLEETTQTLPLMRGEIIEVAIITPDQLSTRLPNIKG